MNSHRASVEGAWRIHRFPLVSSTQDVLRGLVEGGARGRHAVVAEAQSRGRGRHGRRWLSPSGGLYVSLLLAPDPLLFARVGLAIADLLNGLGVPAVLAWPNDVLVRERKIAGVLIEVTGEAALVGVGINVTRAPVPPATCVVAEACAHVVLPDMLSRLLGRIDALRAEAVLAQYRSRCATVGQRVRIDTHPTGGAQRVEGVAVDIDSEGRLIVVTNGRRQAVSTGDCKHLTRDGAVDAAVGG